MKLIDNLPNHLKDKKCYLLKLKDSIDIHIAVLSVENIDTMLRNVEKRKKIRKKGQK